MSNNEENYFILLRNQIAKTHNTEDLKSLIFELGLDWDELQGNTKTTRIQNLIIQMSHLGQLKKLIEALRGRRDNINWADPPPSDQQKREISTAFPKPPLYQNPMFWGFITLGFVIVSMGVLISNYLRIDTLPSELAAAIPTDTPIPTPTNTPVPSPTSLPFPPAMEGETMIVIATFYRPEGMSHNSEVHDEIRRAIENNISEIGLEEKVIVKVEPTILRTENRSEAEALGNQYNASLIIWGQENSSRLEVSFLNLKEPNFEAAEAIVSETEINQITSVSNPEPYNALILEEIPRQFSFLSLFALGQTAYSQRNFEKAIELTSAAINLLPELSNSKYREIALDEAYFLLAYVTNSIEESIAYYDQAISINSEMGKAFNNRARLHAANEDYENALEDHDKAVELADNDNQLAIAIGNRGSTHMAYGETDSGLMDQEEAASISPSWLAFHNLGIAYFFTENYDKALESYNQAITLNSDEPVTLEYRGLLFLVLEDYERALNDFDMAISLDRNRASAYLSRGKLYQVTNDYDLAINDYSKAIILNPSDLVLAETYYHRGSLYFVQEKFEQAVSDLNKAISLDPEIAQAHKLLGDYYFSQNNYQQAIDNYNKAIRIRADDFDAIKRRGISYLEVLDYQKAVEDLDIVLKMEPDDVTALAERARANFAINKFDEVVVDLLHIIELDAATLPIYTRLGETYATLGDFDQAVQALSQAILISTENSEIFHKRGIFYRILEEYDKAIADFDQAILLDQSFAEAYASRAFTYRRLNEYEKALTDYNQAILLDQNNADAYHNRAFVFLDLNNPEQALADVNKAINIDPNDTDYYLSRAEVLRISERWEEAIAEYRHYLELEPLSNQREAIEDVIKELEEELE